MRLKAGEVLAGAYRGSKAQNIVFVQGEGTSGPIICGLNAQTDREEGDGEGDNGDYQ
jgi:hypothetical protein